jgi:hypothetical protein
MGGVRVELDAASFFGIRKGPIAVGTKQPAAVISTPLRTDAE